MTERRLRRIVEVWQERLGLGAWELQLELGALDEDERAVAQVTPHEHYECAVIEFRADWRKFTAKGANRTVLHELLHLAVYDFIRAADGPIRALGFEAGLLAKAALDDAHERVVERLAMRFEALCEPA